MELVLREKACKFVSFNPRPELHGEEAKPAADLHFTMDVPNDVLDNIEPGMKEWLYKFDKTKKGDLAEQGKKHEDGYLPHLRFPSVKPLFKLLDDQVGSTVTVKYGNESVKVPDCVVGDVQLEPQEGGTVAVKFRCQGHPKEKDAGKLYIMVGQAVKVSVGKPRGENEAEGAE